MKKRSFEKKPGPAAPATAPKPAGTDVKPPEVKAPEVKAPSPAPAAPTPEKKP
jgi:hypothetical protein